MSGDLRIYRQRSASLIRNQLIALGFLIILLLVTGLDIRNRGSEYVRALQTFGLVIAGLSVLISWLLRLRNMPRLEIDAESIRYVMYGGDRLKILWQDVERVESWHDGFRMQKGIVGRQVDFQRSGFGKLLFNADGTYRNSRLKAMTQPNHGIPIEPMFAENLYRSDIGHELQRYAPQLFTGQVDWSQGAAP